MTVDLCARALRGVGLSFVAAMLLAGCSTIPSPQAQAENASRDDEPKSLNLYVWSPGAIPAKNVDDAVSHYMAPGTISEFEKATGIRVSVTNFASTDELEAKLAAGSEDFDLTISSSGTYAEEIGKGYYRKLDRGLLPNLANIDPDLLRHLNKYDPAGDHAVVHMWGTIGIGYNVRHLQLRGIDPVSWSVLFDEAALEKAKDCGIAVMASPDLVYGAALAALGKSPSSNDPADVAAATEALVRMRPSLRYVGDPRVIDDLANGSICLAVTYNGLVREARHRAKQQATGEQVGFTIPHEGSAIWFDSYVIPRNARHVASAHAFINYMLTPRVSASITTSAGFASGRPQADRYLSDEVRSDPTIQVSDEIREKLFSVGASSAAIERAKQQGWTKFESGR